MICMNGEGSRPPAAAPPILLLRSHFPAEAAAADLQTPVAAATAAVPGLKVKVTTTASAIKVALNLKANVATGWDC